MLRTTAFPLLLLGSRLHGNDGVVFSLVSFDDAQDERIGVSYAMVRGMISEAK